MMCISTVPSGFRRRRSKRPLNSGSSGRTASSYARKSSIPSEGIRTVMANVTKLVSEAVTVISALIVASQNTFASGHAIALDDAFVYVDAQACALRNTHVAIVRIDGLAKRSGFQLAVEPLAHGIR